MKLSRNLVTWGKISLLMEFCRRVGNSIKKVGGVGKFFFFFWFFCLFFVPQRWRVVSVIRKSPILFLIQRYGQLGWYKSKILLHTGTTDKMPLFRLGLVVTCFWALLQWVDSEHVRITLRPGQYFAPSPPPFGNSY